jgi:hypothetical protein
MFSTLLVIGGVLVGLLVLLALIVSLSARPTTTTTAVRRGDAAAAGTPSWVVDAGRSHPDAWSPPTTEIPAVRG